MKYWDELHSIYATNTTLFFDLGISLLILLVFFIFRKVFSRYIFSKLVKLTARGNKTRFDNKILTAFKKPLEAFIIIIGLYFAVGHLSIYIKEYFGLIGFDIFLGRTLRSLIIVSVAWGFFKLESTSSFLFSNIAGKLQLNFDKLLIPFLSKLLRFVTVALAFIIILQEWGYNVNGFIAGLGLGGLAFALAAQKTLENVFGGLVIVLDKPFTIDDWIVSADIEGFVEDINFRSTRIRRFDQALVTVPNSQLASSSIVNRSKMDKRQVTFNVGVKYSTPKEKLQKTVQDIKNMLDQHCAVDKELILVRFSVFNSSSLDIFLYFYTGTTSWEEYMAAKEDINFKIMDILEMNGVEVAFPSQSIYFETELEQREVIK